MRNAKCSELLELTLSPGMVHEVLGRKSNRGQLDSGRGDGEDDRA